MAHSSARALRIAVALLALGSAADASSDPAERLAEIGAARAKLAAEVAKHAGWRLCDGDTVVWGSDSYKFSSGASSAIEGAGMSVLAPLGEGKALYAEAAALVGALGELKKASSLELDVRSVELAMADPEQYRAQILKLIAEDAARTREALAPGSELTFSGLSSPVRARKLDDRDLALFLDYRIELRAAASAR